MKRKNDDENQRSKRIRYTKQYGDTNCAPISIYNLLLWLKKPFPIHKWEYPNGNEQNENLIVTRRVSCYRLHKIMDTNEYGTFADKIISTIIDMKYLFNFRIKVSNNPTVNDIIYFLLEDRENHAVILNYNETEKNNHIFLIDYFLDGTFNCVNNGKSKLNWLELEKLLNNDPDENFAILIKK